MSTDYSRALGARLRAIRNQQGLSLQGVEDKSHGRWKAVVVGSYERGDRAVTVQRLSELAVFYGVPVSELLPDPRPSSAVTTNTKIVLNLESLGSLPADEAGPLCGDDLQLLQVEDQAGRRLGRTLRGAVWQQLGHRDRVEVGQLGQPLDGDRAVAALVGADDDRLPAAVGLVLHPLQGEALLVADCTEPGAEGP